MEILGKRPAYRIEINHQLKNGNNGQSKHWSNSHKERKAWLNAVLSPDVGSYKWSCADQEWQSIRSIPRYTHADHSVLKDPIGLHLTRVFSGRQRAWDCDSILRGSAKQLIDSLVEANVVEDDSPRFIEWAIGTQEKCVHSCTVVQIYV